MLPEFIYPNLSFFEGNVEGYLEACPGVMRASNLRDIGEFYDSRAFVPLGTWSPYRCDASSVPRTRELVKPRFGLIRLDNGWFKNFMTELGDVSAVPEGRRTPQFTPLVRSLCDRLEASTEPIVQGVVWDEPGLETVTVSRKTGKFLGIHLDSWDGSTLQNRDASRTRICVNLGPERRSLLIVPYTLRSMIAVLDKSANHTAQQAQEILPTWFESFPNTTILRLTLDPGMAYFADTDNLLHDGSSSLASRRCLHFTFRAHFNALA